MVDPLSVALGIGVAVVVLLAAFGLFAGGWIRGRAPDHIVDMNEVSNYQMHVQANEALAQDVDDADG